MQDTREGPSALNPVPTGKVLTHTPAKSEKSGRQGERTDAALLDAIYSAVQQRPTVKSAELYREMEADKALAPLLPQLRAFRGHVAAMRELIDEQPWSPADADDEEARLVLPVIGRMRQVERPRHDRIRALLADETQDRRGRRVLAAQAARTGGLTPYWPTPRVAKWIARIRRWLPDMQGAGDYILPATWYAAREARGAPTADLDEKMAEIAARYWPSKEETE